MYTGTMATPEPPPDRDSLLAELLENHAKLAPHVHIHDEYTGDPAVIGPLLARQQELQLLLFPPWTRKNPGKPV